MAACYRHPDRETGVSCSNCGKPICPDCMTATPVGMRCPDCSRQKTPVRSMRTMYVDPTVTYVFMGICILMYFGQELSTNNAVTRDFALWGPAVGLGDEWWRLLTAGFLHGGLFHLALNMYALYWLGRMIEPVLGHVRFVALYLASLLCGSFGALLFSPDAVTVGASTAIFGLLGASVVMARSRGIDLMASGIGPILLINLVITFVPGFNISIGGHLGGLVGGFLAMLAIEGLARQRRSQAYAVAACVALAVVAVAGSIAFTSSQYV